jgi:hypothetical protein
VTWYRKDAKGGWLGRGEEEQPYQPTISDLETGIVYATDWPFPHASVQSGRTPLSLSPSPSPEHSVQRRIQGVVKACRVITVFWSEQTIQTHLTIDR